MPRGKYLSVGKLQRRRCNFTKKILRTRRILTLSFGNPMTKKKKKEHFVGRVFECRWHTSSRKSPIRKNESKRSEEEEWSTRETTHYTNFRYRLRVSRGKDIFQQAMCTADAISACTRGKLVNHQRGGASMGIGRVGMAEKENSLRIPYGYGMRRTPAPLNASGSRSKRDSRHLGAWGRGARKTTRKTTDSLRTWLVRSKRSSVT